MFEISILARARVAVGDQAVLQAHVAEAELREIRVLRRLAFRRLRARLVLLAEVPVGAPVPVHLQVDHRLDQDEAVDLDLARQQRPDLQLHEQGLEGHHLGLAGARGVGEDHVFDHKLEARKQRESEVAPDFELAPGRVAGPLGDLVLVGVHGNEERRRDQNHDSQNHEGDEPDEQLLHASFLLLGVGCQVPRPTRGCGGPSQHAKPSRNVQAARERITGSLPSP